MRWQSKVHLLLNEQSTTQLPNMFLLNSLHSQYVVKGDISSEHSSNKLALHLSWWASWVVYIIIATAIPHK